MNRNTAATHTATIMEVSIIEALSLSDSAEERAARYAPAGFSSISLKTL